MRSSKNRSRSKGNRNRSVGNIVNRVFDSSGPEGKVRGTPQQIIDKYNQLARDAQLANDRVAAENFQQHAEHYLRMLAEAQREQEQFQQQQQQQHQQQRPQQPQGGQRDRDVGPDRDMPEAQAPVAERAPERDRRPEPEARGAFDAVMDGAPEGDSGLVETPESAQKPRRSRSRRPRKAEGSSGEGEAGSPQEAAE